MPPSRSRRTNESAIDAWIRALRHDLLLQVFLGNGAYWGSVDALRDEFGVNPECRIPPPMTRSVHLPPSLDPNDAKLFKQWHRRLLTLRFHAPIEIAGVIHPQVWWPWWTEFFSATVCFDPPPNELRRFAAAFDETLGDATKRLLPAPEPPADHATRVLRSSPHIKPMIDPQVSHDLYVGYYGLLLQRLQEKFGNLGIDILAEAEALQATQEFEDMRRFMTETEAKTRYPYIAIGPGTSDRDARADVRAVREYLRLSLPEGRRRSSGLDDVQIAIWHDLADHSHAEIAAVMGWKPPRERPGLPPSSPSVFNALKRGRSILDEGDQRNDWHALTKRPRPRPSL